MRVKFSGHNFSSFLSCPGSTVKLQGGRAKQLGWGRKRGRRRHGGKGKMRGKGEGSLGCRPRRPTSALSDFPGARAEAPDGRCKEGARRAAAAAAWGEVGEAGGPTTPTHQVARHRKCMKVTDSPEDIAIAGSLAETIFAGHTLSLVARSPVTKRLVQRRDHTAAKGGEEARGGGGWWRSRVGGEGGTHTHSQPPALPARLESERRRPAHASRGSGEEEEVRGRARGGCGPPIPRAKPRSRWHPGGAARVAHRGEDAPASAPRPSFFLPRSLEGQQAWKAHPFLCLRPLRRRPATSPDGEVCLWEGLPARESGEEGGQRATPRLLLSRPGISPESCPAICTMRASVCVQLPFRVSARAPPPPPPVGTHKLTWRRGLPRQKAGLPCRCAPAPPFYN